MARFLFSILPVIAFALSLAAAAATTAPSGLPASAGKAQVSSKAASDGVLPWAGALTPGVASGPAPLKVAPRPTLDCAEGIKNFPFLKPWIQKLDDFAAPFEVGSNEGSLFYALGVVAVSKTAADAWKNDAVVMPVEWRGRAGGLESSWLGARPAKNVEPTVKPGPGDGRAMMLEARFGDLSKAGRWSRLWSLLYSPLELDLLSACTTSSCKIKFDDEELKHIAGSAGQYKLMQFVKVLDDRMDDFEKKNYVRAYEGSHQGLDWLDLRLAEVFPGNIATHFWIPTDRVHYGYDYLDAAPGSHKPVVGVFARSCEKRGTGAGAFTACSDIVLYNNHYFDFWGRIVLFFPWCGTQVAMAYETADIDQIKESRIIRVLFGGEMRDLMGRLLEVRLKRLRVLGNDP